MALRSEKLYQALQAAGVFHPDDTVLRFVIDARLHEPVRIFVERIGDEPLATILPQELRDLDSGHIFASAPAQRTEVGEPETVRETQAREERTGTHLTEGEPRTVDNR